VTFPSKLLRIQRKNRSLLCIGLDPETNKVPEFLFAYGDPLYEFNRRIIDATRDIVCAYKINLAFYEVTGEHGWYTVHQTLARIPEDIVTIGDAKRGDIGHSSEAYARLIMGDYEFGACTVSPFMGEDSVAPFLRRRNQGAFVLTLTSNPGAKDFQYLPVRGRPLFEHVVAKAKKWNSRGNVGLVVGATRPKELKRIRSLAPDMPILIPGIGVQKGDLESAVRYGCDHDGLRAIFTASRSVMYASNGEDFARAARAEAVALRDRINVYRAKYFS
jgi:orotidine-5'-phosphate decarboxylase